MLTTALSLFATPPPAGASRGSARWMRLPEMLLRANDSQKPGAFQIGRSYRRDSRSWQVDLAKADNLSIGLIGDSGEGKGRSVLVRNAAKYDGSLLLVDVMGEGALTTAQVRARDHGVLVLDPMGVCAEWRGGEQLGLEGGLNPLDTLDRSDPYVVDYIRELVAMLIEDEEGENYWPPVARRFVAAFYGYIVAHPKHKRPDDWTLASVLDFFDEKEFPEKVRERLVNEEFGKFPWPNDLGRLIRDGAAAWSKQTVKGKTIIRDVIMDNLIVLGSKPFRRALSSGPIEFRDLKRKKASIYIVLPTGNIRSHGVWLRILVDTAVRELGKEKTHPDVPALLLLDEFANLGKLERIKDAVTYARGDGYRILWTIQDSNQLKELYGEAWRTMLAQTGILILLGAQDYEMREEISRDIGDTEVFPRMWWWKAMFNLFWRDRHFKLESETVPLYRADEIRDFCSLHRGFGLVRIRGCRWARFVRVNYDDVLEAGVDYIVHPRFSAGAIEPAAPRIEKEKEKLLEAA